MISAEDMQHKVFEPIIAPILEQLRQMLTTPLRKQDRAQGADILVLAGGGDVLYGSAVAHMSSKGIVP